MHHLELKVPPPAVTAIAAVLMWLLTRAAPQMKYTFSGSDFCAAGLAIAGICIAALGVISFLRAKTTVNPMRPGTSTYLVVSGIYRLTRNPMYLGLLLILFGWSVFLSNVLAFLLLPAFVLYINRFQIAPEERALDVLFGEEFRAYRSRTRRWL